MGMFDGVLGGIVGAGLVSIVSDVLEKHGGVQGVVSQFEKNGLGATVQSWVGTGPNQPVSPDDVRRVLGPGSAEAVVREVRRLNPGSDAEARAGVAPSRGQADAGRDHPEVLTAVSASDLSASSAASISL